MPAASNLTRPKWDRFTRTTLVLIVAAATASTLPVVQANHPQQGDFARVTFDHNGGNEWWVEVRVTTSAPHMFVNFRTESGQFGDMARSNWDPDIWVIGTHVPRGERVQFQALLSDGQGNSDYVTSCFFTHPAGVEQCDPHSTDDFWANFHDPSGNTWWQQVYIDGVRPIHYAYMIMYGINGGRDFSLEKKSWGAYATSQYAPSGTIVQFYAVSGDESAASACYKWPEIVVTTCPKQPDSISAADTTFDHKTGNEWWVEVVVGPYEPSAVVARDNGGPWVTLTKRSWGAWANSFHIEPGHKVQFIATVQDGRYQSCWFTHPQGLAPDGSQTCGNTFLGPA